MVKVKYLKILVSVAICLSSVSFSGRQFAMAQSAPQGESESHTLDEKPGSPYLGQVDNEELSDYYGPLECAKRLRNIVITRRLDDRYSWLEISGCSEIDSDAFNEVYSETSEDALFDAVMARRMYSHLRWTIATSNENYRENVIGELMERSPIYRLKFLKWVQREKLLPLLNDENDEVRQAAAAIIAKWYYPGELDLFISIIEGEYPLETRLDAIVTLRRFYADSERAVTELEKILEKGTPQERAAAAGSFFYFGEKARSVVDALKEALDHDSDTEVKIEAVKSLAGVAPEESIQILENIMQGDDEELKTAALWALETLIPDKYLKKQDRVFNADLKRLPCIDWHGDASLAHVAGKVRTNIIPVDEPVELPVYRIVKKFENIDNEERLERILEQLPKVREKVESGLYSVGFNSVDKEVTISNKSLDIRTGKNVMGTLNPMWLPDASICAEVALRALKEVGVWTDDLELFDRGSCRFRIKKIINEYFKWNYGLIEVDPSGKGDFLSMSLYYDIELEEIGKYPVITVREAIDKVNHGIGFGYGSSPDFCDGYDAVEGRYVVFACDLIYNLDSYVITYHDFHVVEFLEYIYPVYEFDGIMYIFDPKSEDGVYSRKSVSSTEEAVRSEYLIYK